MNYSSKTAVAEYHILYIYIYMLLLYCYVVVIHCPFNSLTNDFIVVFYTHPQMPDEIHILYIIPLKQGGHVSRVFCGRCTRGLREQGQGNGMIPHKLELGGGSLCLWCEELVKVCCRAPHVLRKSSGSFIERAVRKTTCFRGQAWPGSEEMCSCWGDILWENNCRAELFSDIGFAIK